MGARAGVQQGLLGDSWGRYSLEGRSEDPQGRVGRGAGHDDDADAADDDEVIYLLDDDLCLCLSRGVSSLLLQ